MVGQTPHHGDPRNDARAPKPRRPPSSNPFDLPGNGGSLSHLPLLSNPLVSLPDTKPPPPSLSEPDIVFPTRLLAALINARSKNGGMNQRSFEQGWGDSEYIKLVDSACAITSELLGGRLEDDPLLQHLRYVANQFFAERSSIRRGGETAPIAAYELNNEALRQGVFRGVFEPDPERRNAIQDAGKALASHLLNHPMIQEASLKREGVEGETTSPPSIRKAASLLLLVGVGVVRAVEQLSVPPAFEDFLTSESSEVLQLSGLYLPAARAILLNSFQHLLRSGINMECLAQQLSGIVLDCYDLERHLYKIEDRGKTYRVQNIKEWMSCALDDAGVVESCSEAFMTGFEFTNALDDFSSLTLDPDEGRAPSAFGEQMLRELARVALYTYHEGDEPLFFGFLKAEAAAVREIHAVQVVSSDTATAGRLTVALDENGDIAAGSHFLDAPFLTAQEPQSRVIHEITESLQRRLASLLESHSEVLFLNDAMNDIVLIEQRDSLFLLSKQLSPETAEILAACGWERIDTPLGQEFKAFLLDSFVHRYRYVGHAEFEPSEQVAQGHTVSALTWPKIIPSRGLDFDGFRKILVACGAEYDESTGGTHPAKFLFNGHRWPVGTRFQHWDAIFPNMLLKAARRLEVDMDRLRQNIALWERGEL